MKKTKVEYRKLRTVWGYAYVNENKIHLWDNLRHPRYAKKHLEVLIHEKLHIMFPDLDETAILRHGKDLSQFLWDNGYKKKQ